MSSKQMTWRVEGMHCPHCEVSVVRAVSPLPGIRQPEASFRRGTLTAQWDESLTPLDEIQSRLKSEGYALSDRRDGAPWRPALQLLAIAACLIGLYLLMSRSDVLNRLNAFPVAKAGMSLGALFLVGLMTSLHCVAMCGGISIAHSASAAQHGRAPVRANLLYNLGRVISYTVIGGIVGALGMVFSISAQVKAAIQIAAAAWMLIMALNLLGGFSWLRRLTLPMPRKLTARISARVAGHSSFFLGLANGLMPCGPLQSMQLYALSTGIWWMGTLSMLCFSLGTVPLMLCIGLVGGRLNQRFAQSMRVISALLVMLMGMSMLTNGLALAGMPTSASTVATPDGMAQIIGDRQVVRTELDYGTYDPITVQVGIPVEWTLVADESRLNGCNNEIVIPAYGLTIPLEPGENRIEFTPQASGIIPFSCWMGMIRSSIHVVDSLASAESP